MTSATVTITRVYCLYPNQQMKKVLDNNMEYRRYCWNLALETWNDMYQARDLMLTKSKRLLIAEALKLQHELLNNKRLKASTIKRKMARLQVINDQLTDNDWELAKINPSPTWQRVRDILVDNKEYWQQNYSSRILQLAVQDLGKAFANFFNKAQPNLGLPKFKSRFANRQGFKTDRLKIQNNCLVLDQPRHVKESWSPLTISEPLLSNKFGVVSFYRERNNYYVAIPFKISRDQLNKKSQTTKVTGVDRNVGHFDTLDGSINVCPSRLDRLYKRVKHYQRALAKKRLINGKKKAQHSHNYQKVRQKLQQAYHQIHNIQYDLMHKFTTILVTRYNTLVIEDLNVNGMQMSHVASKGLHRSMFGLFKRLLMYKCNWYKRTLILANRFYPSTQRCAYCGMVKKGDDKITLNGNKKHHTNHSEYVCYNPNCPMYRVIRNRDYNAVQSLTALIDHPELNHAY